MPVFSPTGDDKNFEGHTVQLPDGSTAIVQSVADSEKGNDRKLRHKDGIKGVNIKHFEGFRLVLTRSKFFFQILSLQKKKLKLS